MAKEVLLGSQQGFALAERLFSFQLELLTATLSRVGRLPKSLILKMKPNILQDVLLQLLLPSFALRALLSFRTILPKIVELYAVGLYLHLEFLVDEFFKSFQKCFLVDGLVWPCGQADAEEDLLAAFSVH